MTERRFHHHPLPASGGPVALSAEASHHAKVLRLDIGETVVLFDAEGAQAEGTILAWNGDTAVCRVGPPSRPQDATPRLVLCQALPKGPKIDDIVRACTEVGIAEIRFFVGARSVSRVEEKRMRQKLERLHRVALEAARQSGRAGVPTLHPPRPLHEILSESPATARRCVCVPGVPVRPRVTGAWQEGWVVVGPEGGLSPEEVEVAELAGFERTSLGPYTLRVETAAPIACAIVLQSILPAR